MGIFSMKEEIKLTLVEIRESSVVVRFSKQLYDGPCSIGEPDIKNIVLFPDEEIVV